MAFIVDSDVFLHDLLHTDRGVEAKDFMDAYMSVMSTTVLNVMEIGSVLARKYRWKKMDIDSALSAIKRSLSVLVPTEYDMLEAMELSMEHYLTPIDALMLVMSKNKDMTLITFDREILRYDGKIASVKEPGSV